MKRDESAVAVAKRKLFSGVERESDGSRVSRYKNIRHNRFFDEVRHRADIAGIIMLPDVRVGPAIESTLTHSREVVGHEIIAEQIALIDDSPQPVCHRLPCKPFGI